MTKKWIYDEDDEPRLFYGDEDFNGSAYPCNDSVFMEIIANKLNELEEENEQLKQSIQEYKAILQDIGILISDEDVVNIRNDIADKLLKPLFKSNGFDVDIDTTNGFTIIPNGDVE